MLDVFKYDVINDIYLNETPLEAINTKYHEGVIAFSPTGDTMYFARETYYSKSYYKDSIVKNGSKKTLLMKTKFYMMLYLHYSETVSPKNGLFVKF